jgi:UDPglucose 6-dehydrogenase
VARGIGLDSRIGNRFLQAGIGWGGSCFGKDTSALITTGKEYGLPMSITQAAKEVNTRQRARVIEILMQELKILKGKKIGILGLAFKPFTDDLRDAPAHEIAQTLISRGAKVCGFDPVAMDKAKVEWKGLDLHYANSIDDVFDEADAVLLITEWSDFKDLSFDQLAQKMRNKLAIDGRGLWDASRMKSANIKLVTLGRSHP